MNIADPAMTRDPEERHCYPSAIAGWTTVGVLFLFYIFSMIDRQIMTMMVSPIKRDLHIDDIQMSLLLGLAFAVCYATAGLLLGWLVDRSSRRALISICITLWGLASAACGLAGSFHQLFVLRMLVGLGEAALGPAAYSLLSDSFPRRKLTLAIAVYVAGGIIGSGLAVMFGGLVIDYSAQRAHIDLPWIGEVGSWRLVFILTGLPGPLLALLAFVFREPARSGLAPQSGGMAAPGLLTFLRTQARPLLWLCIGFSGVALLVACTSTWMPSILERQYRMNPTGTGLAMSLLLLGAALPGLPFCGWWIDRKVAAGRSAMYIGYFSRVLPVAIPFGIAAPLMPTSAGCILMFIPFYFFVFPYISASTAAIQVITPNQFRGRTSALFMMITTLIGLSLGPTLVAAISTALDPTGHSLGMALAVVLGAAGGVTVLALRMAEKSFPGV